MPPTWNELRFELIAAIAMAGLIYFAWAVGGFLGVGVLGLLTLFIAFQVDLHKAETALLPAMRQQQRPMDHAEKAARQAEIEQLARPILTAKLLGFGLALIGFGELYFS